MLRQGYTHLRIAKVCGVSRTTVSNIANGKVTVVRDPKSAPSGEALRVFGKTFGRCPEHGKIRLPCVICAAELYRKQHPERHWVDPIPGLNERATAQDIADRWRWFNELDDLVNR
jgi:hypothetical protein